MKIDKDIKLSVVVAAYNIENYIDKCLTSLINQTYKDIEILVVNDGSTDKTKLIIEKYEKTTTNLKLLNKENRGLSSARNYGIINAKGEYLAFVDGDDYLELQTYELIMKKMEEEQSELGIFNFKKIYDNKIILPDLKPFLYKGNFLKTLFSKSNEGSIVVWNKIFKRNIVMENEIFFENKAFFEDTGFIFRYLYFVKKITLIDLPLYNYIQREGSITKKFNSIIVESYKNTYKLIKKFYEIKGVYKNEVEDMKIRMEIYILNYFLKNELMYPIKIEFKNIFKSKIPIKHKIVLFLVKIKIYKYIFKLYYFWNFAI